GAMYTLVQIEDAAENAFVRAAATAAFGNVDLHLGGTDAAAENTWVWDGGDPFWQGGPSGTNDRRPLRELGRRRAERRANRARRSRRRGGALAPRPPDRSPARTRRRSGGPGWTGRSRHGARPRHGGAHSSGSAY